MAELGSNAKKANLRTSNVNVYSTIYMSYEICILHQISFIGCWSKTEIQNQSEKLFGQSEA